MCIRGKVRDSRVNRPGCGRGCLCESSRFNARASRFVDTDDSHMCESACLRNIQYTRAYTSGCRRRRASASSAHPRHILYTHTGLFIHENHPLMHELGNNPLQLLRCPQFAHPGWRMCETLLAEDQRLGAGDQGLARGRRGALPAPGLQGVPSSFQLSHQLLFGCHASAPSVVPGVSPGFSSFF